MFITIVDESNIKQHEQALKTTENSSTDTIEKNIELALDIYLYHYNQEEPNATKLLSYANKIVELSEALDKETELKDKFQDIYKRAHHKLACAYTLHHDINDISEQMINELKTRVESILSTTKDPENSFNTVMLRQAILLIKKLELKKQLEKLESKTVSADDNESWLSIIKIINHNNMPEETKKYWVIYALTQHIKRECRKIKNAEEVNDKIKLADELMRKIKDQADSIGVAKILSDLYLNLHRTFKNQDVPFAAEIASAHLRKALKKNPELDINNLPTDIALKAETEQRYQHLQLLAKDWREDKILAEKLIKLSLYLDDTEHAKILIIDIEARLNRHNISLNSKAQYKDKIKNCEWRLSSCATELMQIIENNKTLNASPDEPDSYIEKISDKIKLCHWMLKGEINPLNEDVIKVIGARVKQIEQSIERKQKSQEQALKQLEEQNKATQAVPSPARRKKPKPRKQKLSIDIPEPKATQPKSWLKRAAEVICPCPTLFSFWNRLPDSTQTVSTGSSKTKSV